MLIDLIIGGFLGMMMLGFILHVITLINVGRTAHREGTRLAAGAAALQALLNDQGASIVSGGTATGFASPYTPQASELKAAGYMPQYLSMTMPFGGTMQFTVRREANNDLLGLACDSNSITQSGKPAADIAAKVMLSSSGTGLMTSAVSTTVLNGPGMTNIASPITGPAIVCAWAFLPNPT